MLQLAIDKQETLLNTLRADTNSAQKVFDLLIQDTKARQKVLNQIDKDLESSKQKIFVLQESIKKQQETFERENSDLLIITRRKSDLVKRNEKTKEDYIKSLQEFNHLEIYISRLQDRKTLLEETNKKFISDSQVTKKNLTGDIKELEERKAKLSKEISEIEKREKDLIENELQLDIRKQKIERLYSNYLKDGKSKDN